MRRGNPSGGGLSESGVSVKMILDLRTMLELPKFRLTLAAVNLVS